MFAPEPEFKAMTLPKTYKAASCPGPNKPWQIVTLPLRAPSSEEVLIRVHASGICFSDHFCHTGNWPGLAFPRVTGHEVVGRVAGLGSALQQQEDVTERFKNGALVGVGWNGGYCRRCEFCRKGQFWTCKNGGVTGFTFDGGHAEYMYAPVTAVVSLPEEALEKASYAELAPLFCGGLTVFDAIRTTTWEQGDICVVQGIGGLGHLAIQYAAKMGLKVYAVSSGPSKRSLALSLGASDYIDSSTIDPVEYIQSLGGARIIVCTAPKASHINAIIPAVGKNGTVTLVSAAVDGNIEVANLLLNMNRASVRGWCCGTAPDMEQCVKFSTVADVKSFVQTYPLEEFPNAYDRVMSNDARFRNVIVFP
ncbi:GroES-like protein [Neolentinus lepideus HHB14362 ss-1]|uniref:GroES-like protein n=1 Tax=Neolentinus lepideus HHB14362 ss-1 TaxID=1314782 RepID=A0A165UE54_9AGAM|nr:GroES-like protein [Neolentinus lepideus HHB14362 ss-1]